MLSPDGISYAEGNLHYGTNACNETLSISDRDGQLKLSALMGLPIGSLGHQFDLKRMSQGEAADYLWRRFVAPLER